MFSVAVSQIFDEYDNTSIGIPDVHDINALVVVIFKIGFIGGWLLWNCC